MGLIAKTIGTTFKAGVGLAKGAGKVIKTAGHTLEDVGEEVISNTGEHFVGGVVKAGKATKGIGKALTKEVTDMNDQTLYGRLVGRRLNNLGAVALTAGTMGVTTLNAMADNVNNSKIAKLGYTSASDNLDRLISYDGSGFLNRINEVSGNDPEVLSDIVSNTFTNPNQFGANGDIVFALHNMREG